tara:strand:+ start:207 stop:491 length:285 start_codon:yes stop_codon:yes gene_type:complete
MSKSDKPKKKYYALFKRKDNDREKRVFFGSAGMSDFTKNKDVERKKKYISRHQKRENWNDPLTAGFWAKRILWNKPTISASLSETKTKLKSLGY